jgi:hypothetical protein
LGAFFLLVSFLFDNGIHVTEQACANFISFVTHILKHVKLFHRKVVGTGFEPGGKPVTGAFPGHFWEDGGRAGVLWFEDWDDEVLGEGTTGALWLV